MATTNHTPIGPQPYTYQEFIPRIRSAQEPCTCDEHQPHLHHCTQRHKTIQQHHNTRNSGLVRSTQDKYEALHLARAAIKYFDRPEKDLKPEQKEALDEIRKLIKARKDFKSILWRLGFENAARSVAKEHMEKILDMFNRLFFFGALDLSFIWEDSLANLGQCRLNGSASQVEMHGSMIDNHVEGAAGYNGNTIARLATLLHEALHAYFQQYACNLCSMHNTNIGAGHDRAFQIVSVKLDEVTERLLGLRLSIHRFRGYRSDWDYIAALPSEHDLEEWKWELERDDAPHVEAGPVGVVQAIGDFVVDTFTSVTSLLSPTGPS